VLDYNPGRMVDFLEIKGGRRLSGTVTVSGAKNAALPMLMATLLTSEECTLSNIPNLLDVDLTLGLLEHFGAEVNYFGSTIKVKTPKLKATEASYSLVKALRASFWVLGPLLARGRAARVALPGGDAIGTRPVDIHLQALTKMGADISLKHGVVFASAPNGLRPIEIDFHFASVGATHQVMMAAALTPGTTVIRGAAREPEIVALAEMLTQMGALIEGAGSSVVSITGRESLDGCNIKMIGDRIEAGTFLLAGLITRGEVEVKGFNPDHLGEFISILLDMGAILSPRENGLLIKQESSIKPIKIRTDIFPGFATDLQAPLMAALCLARGESQIEESIFEGRFGHVQELARMGANIEVHDRMATIMGVNSLSAAPVEAKDIRGGASLVLASLAADGVSRIFEIDHLRRGYANLEAKLSGLGAEIGCKPEEIEDAIAIGC